MFSKRQIKLIKSLSLKKFRIRERLFIVEGKKGIFELLHSGLLLHSIYTTKDIFDTPEDRTLIISEADLNKVSNLSTPQIALAVFHFPEVQLPSMDGLTVVLDEIQDPGNLGTIIRMCDWFGIKDLICSHGTVDCFNPKVVQATMGSIARVNINYLDLPEFLKKAKKNLPVYGAFLEGENLYTQSLIPTGMIVMGNEANGISLEVEKLVTQKLSIPQFGESSEAESLNVATAAAIFLSEFRRKSFY